MNVKTVLPSHLNVLDRQEKVDTSERAVTTAASDKDRDGNGRRDPDSNPDEKQERHLSEKEMATAIDYLLSLPGVQASSLKIRWEQAGDIKIAYVEDADGKVIRRITELELSTINQDKDRQTGQILDKAG